MKSKAKIIKSIISSKLKHKIYKLNFAITSKCNSRCKTCNVWGEYKNNPEIAKKDLSFENIERIFKNLPKSVIWLSLSGGEPFLRNDLEIICLAAVKNIPNLKIISIPSNGLLPEQILLKTKKILESSLNNLFINFSLDGPAEIHDEIRGVKGAFTKTWTTYNKILDLSKSEPRLQVNIESTISNYNLNYLEDFFSELIENGHKITITIAHEGYLYKNNGLKNNYTQIHNHQEKIKKISLLIRKNLSKTSPLDIIQKIYLENIDQFHRSPKKQPLSCVASKYTIALDSRGNIIPCFMWGETLGNIKNYGYNLEKFLELNNKAIQEVQKKISMGQCPNCWTPCEAYQSIINSFLEGNLSKLF